MDTFTVRFDGKNFALWEFQFRLFVQGRRLSAILDGTAAEPGETATAKVKEDWAVNNAQVMGWILGSVDPSIALSLRSFTTAHAMWSHLTAFHSQSSASRKFDVELDIARLHQGDMDILSYYQEAVTLWTEHDMLTMSLISAAASAEVQQERTSSRLMHFLMKLRPEFESIRSSLLHRNVT
ncbi:unnamed protein product [Linum trigynum]|uniref:Retrotransposon Copia-like N-terminal domain-containing protein n=1 Tax=Linum trigynum TaxID=586398 RepID=A0AAV2E8N8_9ROSI